MTHTDNIQAFADELDKLVDRFRAEFDLPYASAVGVLSLKIFLLQKEQMEEESEQSG